MATGGVLGYNGNVYIKSGGGVWKAVDSVGPPVVPDMTLRFSFSNTASDPTTLRTVGTWTNVGSIVVDGVRYENVWDWTYNNTTWHQAFSAKIKNAFDPDVKVIQSGNNSRVTNMSDMFEKCYSLTTVLTIDTSNVTNTHGMFYECTKLTSVPLFDTSKVTDMEWMFDRCYSLATVPLFNTSNVTDMSYMFGECTSLKSVPLFNTSNVTEMEYMFNGCTSLTSVPLFNTSNVTDMGYMFQNCTSLTSVTLFNTSKVTKMEWMFNGCNNIKTGMLALYNQASSKSIAVTAYRNCFRNAGTNTTTGMAERAQIPTTWGGDK